MTNWWWTYPMVGVLACSLPLVVAGCSDGGGGRADGGIGDGWTFDAADTKHVQGDSTSNDAGPSDGDAELDGSDTAEETLRYGRVDLAQQRSDSRGVFYTRIDASFLRGPASIVGPVDCATTSKNACRFSDCARTDKDPSDFFVSAGTLTVSGGKREVVMEPGSGDESLPGPENYAFEQSRNAEIWDGGQTLEVEAEGATVPAFSETLRPPADIELRTPASASSLDVEPDEPLEVEWDGRGLADTDFRVLLTRTTDSRLAQITCEWEAASGTGTIPRELLRKLDEVDASETFYQFEAGVQKSTRADAYRITLEASETASFAESGEAASGER